MSHVETSADPYEELAALFLTDDAHDRDATSAVEEGPRALPDVAAPIEVALVGHLPVMGGLWLTQYADQVGRRIGPTALVRLERGQVALELVRASRQHVGLEATDTFDDALRSIAGIARNWIICPQGEAALDGPFPADALTLLTGGDDAATVAAYRIVKSLAERWHASGWLVPSIGLIVFGASMERAAQVVEKLDRTTKAFLDVDLEVAGQYQRMDAIESAGRRTFPGLEMQVGEACRRIRAACSSAPRVPPRPPAHGAPAAKLGPKGIERERSAPMARSAPAPQPVPIPEVQDERLDLAARLPGIEPLPARCPMHRNVELAVDVSGSLQLVCTLELLGSLRAVEAWAIAHADLLRLACPRLMTVDRVTTHVVTEDARSIIPLHGTGVRLHLLMRANEAWIHAPLS